MSESHDNPVDESDVTDAERAEMLKEYLDAFTAEFGTEPLLMPLDSGGKGPAIKGRCSLDSETARNLLVNADEAVRQIREDSARGFCLYAGRDEHGTEHVAFVDHDSAEFETPTGEPTLEVLSGSGRGTHETYRNDPENPVANARVGANLGEIRAKNWYVVLPGSIHPSGGVYHVHEYRGIATISDADLTDRERPVSAQSTENATGDTEETNDNTEATSTTTVPDGVKTVLQANAWIGTYLAMGGADDRSTKDFAVCRELIENGIGELDAYKLLNGSTHTKVHERDQDYWRETWANARTKAQSATDGGVSTGQTRGSTGEDSGADSDSWESVYDAYENAAFAPSGEKDIRKKKARYKALQLLLDTDYWATNKKNNLLYHYDNGVFTDDGKNVVDTTLSQLHEHNTIHERREITGQLRGHTGVDESELGGPANHVCTQDCVLQIDGDSVDQLDHSPTFRFLSQLETKYRQNAKAPTWIRCLKEWLPNERTRLKVQEYAGYCLMHWDLPYHKALFLVGPTASGKSTFLKTVKSLLGKHSTTNYTPQKLTTQRFAGAGIYGKWANIRNEIPTTTLEGIETFKEIAAGDPIEAEWKFKESFEFEPTAKHLYAGNELPDIETDDEAFFRRILLAPFLSTVPVEDRDEDLGEKLQSELPGILNWAIEGLQRLQRQRGFTGDRSPGETQLTWELWANAIDRFADDCLNEAPGANIPTIVAHKTFEQYCQDHNAPGTTQHKMTKRLREEHDIETGHAFVDDAQQRCLKDVQFTAIGEEIKRNAIET